MAGFKRTVTIDRPVEQVFDFATDLANASKFLPNITKVEMVTDGGMKPGAKFRETRAFNGKERAAVIEVVDHQRPSVHAGRAAMLGMKATYTFRFFPDGAGTRVEMIADIQGNFLWWPFLGMMARMMDKDDGEYLNRLKEAMAKQSALSP